MILLIGSTYGQISYRPAGLNGSEQASRWDIHLKLLDSTTHELVPVTGIYPFTNVNTQKVLAFPKEPLITQQDQIINLATTTKLRGHFDTNNQYFDIRAQSNYTNSSDMKDRTAAFLYLFRKGQLNFSVVRSASPQYPATMFIRGFSNLPVAQSLPQPSVAATNNKNGKLFDTNQQFIANVVADLAPIQIFQNFPLQPNESAPRSYEISLTLPATASLNNVKQVQISSNNYQPVTTTITNAAQLISPQTNNSNGTTTYHYLLKNVILSGPQLVFQFNPQVNWDNPQIMAQLIDENDSQYLPITASTQIKQNQQNFTLPAVTTKVQIPTGKIKFHYCDQNKKELQSAVLQQGTLGKPANYQAPTSFVNKYNQEYQYLKATDDQGQPVDLNQLYYHYNHGKEINIYLTYQNKGLHQSALTDKKIAFLGSSVTRGLAAGEISFVDFLKSEDGIDTIKNAIDGTTLAGNSANTYVNRMKRQIPPQTKLDAFVCQLSTNDVAQNKPLGVISNSKDLAAFDTNTTTGAIEYVIKYVQDTWHCPIIFYTGLYKNNSKYSQLVTRLSELQKKWDFTIIDLYNNPDINNALKQNYNMYMADAINPRKVFYQDYWTPIFREELLKLFNPNKF